MTATMSPYARYDASSWFAAKIPPGQLELYQVYQVKRVVRGTDALS